jgi:hypothetical protein
MERDRDIRFVTTTSSPRLPYEVAENATTYLPTAEIPRSVKVATPDAFVVAVVVPERAPEPDTTVSDAVTVTPEVERSAPNSLTN